MSADSPVALAVQLPGSAIEGERASGTWIESAIAALFAATAVLCVSFVAVMSGLV
jgi:hypothetical protein